MNTCASLSTPEVDQFSARSDYRVKINNMRMCNLRIYLNSKNHQKFGDVAAEKRYDGSRSCGG